MKGKSVPHRRPMSNMGFNRNNLNNNFKSNNIMRIQVNNFMNNNINQNINMFNNYNNFINLGGANNCGQMNNMNNFNNISNVNQINNNQFNNMNNMSINNNINNWNQMNNMNQFNNINNINKMNNMNQINSMNLMNNNQFNNMSQMNNYNQFNNMNRINNNNNQFNNMNQVNNMNQMNNMNQINIMNNMTNMNQFNNINQINNNQFNNMNNMNQFNNMYQINNININMHNNFVKPILNKVNDNNFAFAFRKNISNEIPNQLNINKAKNNFNFPISNSIAKNCNDDINMINMRFSFMSAQTFNVSGKPYEKLSEVINRFKSQCPEPLKKLLPYCIYNAKPVDKNKSLQELGIKNGHQILFIKNKNPRNEFIMNKIENKRFNKFRGEYLSLKILNEIENQKKNNLNSNDFESYVSFYNKKDKFYSVSVKEHGHLLAYCLTNFHWKCNLCYKNYDKSKGRYYCSKCDFNICENCHYKNKYLTKKSFPKNTCPSNSSIKVNFIKTDYHEHNLVYCRCSKNLAFFSDWTCDNCRGNYNNDIWMFYCTLCNYHLCCDCGGYQ